MVVVLVVWALAEVTSASAASGKVIRYFTSILLILGRENFPAPENQTNGEAKPFDYFLLLLSPPLLTQLPTFAQGVAQGRALFGGRIANILTNGFCRFGR